MGMMMDAQDDAVLWVRKRFNDPTHDLDVRIRDHIERDPGFAAVIKEMITRPPAGLRYRMEISRPDEPELATAQALERLNARLRLIGAQAIPAEGARRGCLWTVCVPQSHLKYAEFLVAGRYGFGAAPDGEALSEDVAELSLRQLEALRQCFRETRAHVQAGLARLHGEVLPETSASPSDMLHYLVQQETRLVGGHLAHLEYMDGIVAREQQRRGPGHAP